MQTPLGSFNFFYTYQKIYDYFISFSLLQKSSFRKSAKAKKKKNIKNLHNNVNETQQNK